LSPKSESVTKGLYRITELPATDDLMLVRLLEWERIIAGQRGCLLKNTPALKRISGVSGIVVPRSVFIG